MAVAAFTSTVDALPQWPRATTSLSNLAKKIPANTLPAPTGELKYVLLGVGTQNYTCLTGNATAAPDTTGATGKPAHIVQSYIQLTDRSETLRSRHKIERRPSRAMEDPHDIWTGPLALYIRHKAARHVSQG